MLRIEEFQTVKKHIFGINAVGRIGKEVKILGGKRVLIITDKGLASIGLLDDIIRILKNEQIYFSVFDEVKPEPDLESYNNAVKFAKNERPDVIIGFGGGSSMDVAKVVSIMLNNRGEVMQYVGPPFGTFQNEGYPTILVPTTAGTGSECTQGSVIIVNGNKRDIADSKMFATIAIVDPMLTISMPQNLTAATGIDALSHALESLMSWRTTKLSYMLASEAVRLIFKYLRRAYRDGNDLESRYYMSLASTLAGMAISITSTNLAHAAAYTYAGWKGTPHGVSCGIALPYAMEYYLPAVADKLATIAKEIGLCPHDVNEREAALILIKSVRQLICDLGLPTSLQEIGISREDIPTLILRLESLYQYIWEGGPMPLIKDRIKTFYEKMYEGVL
ncbi:MAG: iron-containing alcohol dehydrogenase [Nitrososphaerota archaeon]